MPLHNDVRVSGGEGWEAGAAAAAAAGDRSIIGTARFVIMIAMLMMALLLQLKVLRGYSRPEPARRSGLSLARSLAAKPRLLSALNRTMFSLPGSEAFSVSLLTEDRRLNNVVYAGLRKRMRTSRNSDLFFLRIQRRILFWENQIYLRGKVRILRIKIMILRKK